MGLTALLVNILSLARACPGGGGPPPPAAETLCTGLGEAAVQPGAPSVLGLGWDLPGGSSLPSGEQGGQAWVWEGPT